MRGLFQDVSEILEQLLTNLLVVSKIQFQQCFQQ